MEILGYLFAAVFGALCLFLSHVAYKLGMAKKYTRKLVHIAIGFEWVILYAFLGATIHSFIVCIAFTALLVVSYFKKLLPMISSDGDNSLGTVYYGISMSVISLVTIFLPDMMVPFGIAVFATSFGDGLAGVVGQAVPSYYNPKTLGEKTILGTITNLAVTFFGSWAMSAIFKLEINALDCLWIALFAASLELVTPMGLDNVSVPIGTVALAYLLAFVPAINGYLAPILLTPIIIAIAIEKKILTTYAVIAAVALDIAVSVAFGNSGFAVIIVFLLLSVISDKVKKYKLAKDYGLSIGKKVRAVTKPRNEIQVLANGGAALVCAVAYIFVPKPIFIAAFVAAMAEALADTLSSGVGVFANNTLDLFRMKKCNKGVSGGVSIPGTVAAIIASFFIPTLAFWLGIIKPIWILWCGLAAFGGCFVDTLLGSLLQEKYRCEKCGAVTDDKTHCNKDAVKISGFDLFDNNVTNFVSNVITTVVIIIIGL